MTDKHAANKALYAIDAENNLRPFLLWKVKKLDGEWERCTVAPAWSNLSEYERIDGSNDFIDDDIEALNADQDRRYAGILERSASTEQADPGQHYRYMYNGINIDPAFIERVCGPMTGMQFTILKKVIRMGSAHKDKRRDLLDIIGAAQRELELMDD